jgi:hypothetical protein
LLRWNCDFLMCCSNLGLFDIGKNVKARKEF